MTILIVLAISDLKRHGKSATRWREYSFLLLCVGIAMVYGMMNDQVTSRISWEYFYYGKELAPIMGPQTPPDRGAMDWQAARIGAAATWWVGLVIGAAMLIANNPSRKYPQLSYRKLIGHLPAFIGIVILCAAIFGWLGHQHLLNWMGQDFREIAEMDLWRPRRFMMVYGIHLGGYVGGIAGMIFSVASIRRERATRIVVMV